MAKRPKSTPPPMFGDASDLPLFSGTPIAPAPRRHAPVTARAPAPAPELPGMPEAPAYVTVNGFRVRADHARGVRIGDRVPHVVYHSGDWRAAESDNAGASKPGAAVDSRITLVSVTTIRARSIEKEPGVWLIRPAMAHEV